MKAVVYDRKSPAGRLIYRDVDKPFPTDDEVLVKVVAVSLNAADYRSLKMGLIPKRKIFGADVAGRIESVGKNISLFKPGDEVMGDLAGYGFGGLAEYVTAPEKALAVKPGNISFMEAAALPMAALTALQALRNKAGIKKGDRVLLIGSAGGVGTFAIQLAKFFGAEVTGVCSSKNIGQTKSLGADHVIDYTKESFTDSGTLYDIILGINGNYPLLAYKKSLAANGTYVMVGGSLSQVLKSLLFGSILSLGTRKMSSLAAKANRDDLGFLGQLMEKNVIRAVIDRKYTLDRAAEAMEYLTQGHAAGKVVITIETD